MSGFIPNERILYETGLKQKKYEEFSEVIKNTTPYIGVYWNHIEKFYMAIIANPSTNWYKALKWSDDPAECAMYYDREIYSITRKQPNYDKKILTKEDCLEVFGVKEPKKYAWNLSYRHHLHFVHGVYLQPEGYYRAIASVKRKNLYIGAYMYLREGIIAREKWLDEHEESHSRRNHLEFFEKGYYGSKKRVTRFSENIEDRGLGD